MDEGRVAIALSVVDCSPDRRRSAGVDDGVLKQDHTGKEQIIEVMNGCICCTVRQDLADVLKGSLAERISDFDGVIIETTGPATPMLLRLEVLKSST